MIAAPYTARQCPICKTWVYTADGPFAEDDETKTIADFDHWARLHADPAELNKAAIGFPFFTWNDQPVEAEREPR